MHWKPPRLGDTRHRLKFAWLIWVDPVSETRHWLEWVDVTEEYVELVGCDNEPVASWNVVIVETHEEILPSFM